MLKSALGRARFMVDAVETAADAREALRLVVFDVAILDLGLPDGDGLDVLTDGRRVGLHIPAMVLTARRMRHISFEIAPSPFKAEMQSRLPAGVRCGIPSRADEQTFGE
jgi:CheY-like chemotaxis protein